MNLKTLAAIFAIVLLPAGALAQQPKNAPKDAPKEAPKAPKPTKASAQKVVQIINADKAKAKIYCDIAKLGEQIDAADQKKDTKKVEELSEQADDMGQKLGPEYVALVDGLSELGPESKEGQEVGKILSSLDKLCAK
jgi:hypothetical protein